jgi:hypothetical protein
MLTELSWGVKVARLFARLFVSRLFGSKSISWDDKVQPKSSLKSYDFNGPPRAEPVVSPLHTLLRQGFGGLSADSEIRRSSNSSVHEVFHDILRIHPRAQPALFCAGG